MIHDYMPLQSVAYKWLTLMAQLGERKLSLTLIFNQMLLNQAVQLNNTFKFTADITHFPEQAVLSCQDNGK